MFKITLITDIHGNLEALEAVLADIKRNNVQDIISLGDNVGYGPDPVAVLRKLHEEGISSLEGNHDLAVIQPSTFDEASPYALQALEWTRHQLDQEGDRDPQFQNILEEYFSTPAFSILHVDRQVILVHGSPGHSKTRFEYLIMPEHMLEPAKYMKNKRLKICFFGHTHHQMLWEVDKSGISLIDFDIDETIEFTEKELKKIQLLINPGSVGQPRDKDPDAAYMFYEIKGQKHIFTFKRVAYNINKTVEKIYRIEQLDNRLGDRLIEGR